MILSHRKEISRTLAGTIIPPRSSGLEQFAVLLVSSGVARADGGSRRTLSRRDNQHLLHVVVFPDMASAYFGQFLGSPAYRQRLEDREMPGFGNNKELLGLSSIVGETRRVFGIEHSRKLVKKARQ